MALDSVVSPISLMLMKVDTQKRIRKSGYAKVDTQLANSGIEVTLIKSNIKFETEIKAKN